MENEKRKDDKEVNVAEFKVSMNCNACERTVAKVIAKLKGVEKFTTDMNKNKVVVTGKIDPQKVLEKLRKKTGNKVEIVGKVEEKENEKANDISIQYSNSSLLENEAFMMFSDENPNACSIM
ncbi:heavy metal-associated isoprenylated plant protein 19 [Gossypium raimondii]|uniref:heavy metal-associated isoprenylated plant protein 19 n=1 Tax=Gossypium raimondii TaxID=29730 RepID=UPI00227BBA92|nr:heavy metal-associated isoprenylated plant protein 19 [Gossypium raimondii]